MRKLTALSDLAIALESDRRSPVSSRVVQCHGCFDFLHLGHVWHLEAAKKHGDILVVTVTTDRFVNKGAGRPIFPVEQRAEMLAALECVDYVSIVDAPNAAEAILTIKPDFYVKGSDYKDSLAGEEERAAQSIGAQIVYTDRQKLSSTVFIKRCAQTLEAA